MGRSSPERQRHRRRPNRSSSQPGAVPAAWTSTSPRPRTNNAGALGQSDGGFILGSVFEDVNGNPRCGTPPKTRPPDFHRVHRLQRQRRIGRRRHLDGDENANCAYVFTNVAPGPTRTIRLSGVFAVQRPDDSAGQQCPPCAWSSCWAAATVSNLELRRPRTRNELRLRRPAERLTICVPSTGGPAINDPARHTQGRRTAW